MKARTVGRDAISLVEAVAIEALNTVLNKGNGDWKGVAELREPFDSLCSDIAGAVCAIDKVSFVWTNLIRYRLSSCNCSTLFPAFLPA